MARKKKKSGKMTETEMDRKEADHEPPMLPGKKTGHPPKPPRKRKKK